MSIATMPDETLSNYRELCGVVAHCAPMDCQRIREHMLALSVLVIDEATYGPFREAAIIQRAEALKALGELIKVREPLEQAWAKRLENFREFITVGDEEIAVDNGHGLIQCLERIADGEPTYELYGHLLPQAEELQRQGIANYEAALRKVGFLIIDPERVPEDTDRPAVVLKAALIAFTRAEPNEQQFGDELPRAQEMYKACVEKYQKLIDKVEAREKESQQARIDAARERRDDGPHRRSVALAAMTQEQKDARLHRIIEAAEPMYEIVAGLYDAANLDFLNQHAELSMDAIEQLAQQAHAMVARVEGRLN